MRALCSVLLLVVLCTSTTGCAMFGKKEGSNERSGGFAWFKKKDSATAPPPPKFPSDPILTPPGTPPPTPPAPTAVAPTQPEAVVAGRVIDAYGRPANNSYVQLVRLDAGKDGESPIDVATGADGYFIIPGLRSGGTYRLIARTKQGDKLLAGITQQQAPNLNVVIPVKEEFASSSIPPLPSPGSAPAAQQKKDGKPPATSALDKPAPPGGWVSTPTGPASTAAEVELPAKLTVPAPPVSPTPPDGPTPGIAAAPNSPIPPLLQIPGAKKQGTPVQPPSGPNPPPLPTPGELTATLQPKVPSCVVVANRVQTLALRDADGQTWDFHRDRKGKVVVLDLWTANCTPCRQAMPYLAQLQNRFGPQGLEVVGVLIDSGTVSEQGNRAKKTCYDLKTNYRQVLGQDDKTDLCRAFGVQVYPTLIVLDGSTGEILWRHAGISSPADQSALEQLLQKRLANQAF
jgi:thiol-disulfide isomerase/thioredoxin